MNNIIILSQLRTALSRVITWANANFLKASGYYHNIIAGLAENLVGRGSVSALFTFRSVGGTADIGNGAAQIKRIYGNTIAWNQLVNLSSILGWQFQQDSSGKFSSNVANDIITITCTEDVNTYNHTNGYLKVKGTWIEVSTTHKYITFLSVKPSKDSVWGMALSNSTNGTVTANIIANTWNRSSLYSNVTAISHGKILFGMPIGQCNTGDTWQIKDIQVIDLTQMFGEGNEPATVAEFEAMFPQPYYEYNPGQLISLNATGLKTVGFNQWDEQWELGDIGDDGMPYPTSNSIRAKNFIPCIPNTAYSSIVGSAGTSGWLHLFYYDEQANFISTGGWPSNGATFTTPSNCKYIRFALYRAYGTLYNNDVCINLSWSGYRNGEYEPYWSNTLALPIASKFSALAYDAAATYTVGNLCVYDDSLWKCTTAITTPEAWNASHWVCIRQSYAAYDATKTYVVGNKVKKDGVVYVCNTAISTAEAWDASHWTATTEPVNPALGQMLSAGTVSDELTEDGMVIRVGAVNLGTLNWIGSSGISAGDRFEAVYQYPGIPPATLHTLPNMLTPRYMTKTTAFLSGHTQDKLIAVITNNIWIYDTSYESDYTSLKTSLNGVMLYYELTTPITVTFADPLDLNYRVDDFGTEMELPQNTSVPTTTPLKIDVQYPMNAVDAIRNLPKNYAGINTTGNASTIGNMLEAMKTAGIIASYDITWDSSNSRYTFTVTRPTEPTE